MLTEAQPIDQEAYDEGCNLLIQLLVDKCVEEYLVELAQQQRQGEPCEQ